MDIIRILSPLVFDRPEIDALFTKASRSCTIWPENYEQAKDEYKWLAEDDHSQVLVGFEDKAPMACSVTLLPRQKLFMPQQFLFYCEGSQQLRLAMAKKCVDFAKAAGYNRGQTANASGIPDDVWLRLHGLKGEAVGTLINFSF
jgi:hypothetical protein